LAPTDFIDERVNTAQTPWVIESNEHVSIDHIVARLTSRYPAIAVSTVAAVVRDVHARYDDRLLRDFVPLFVERNARSELDRLGAMAR
jgi:hypothetical protein